MDFVKENESPKIIETTDRVVYLGYSTEPDTPIDSPLWAIERVNITEVNDTTNNYELGLWVQNPAKNNVGTKQKGFKWSERADLTYKML